ncbi:MAG TPA: tetratricopeptide repeat protein [Opitutales bacterium]|jgi:tetratricopeptide (TPR) repeat protein|nr:tetratricopeptide repeat protein [Opitutales bacterium]
MPAAKNQRPTSTKNTKSAPAAAKTTVAVAPQSPPISERSKAAPPPKPSQIAPAQSFNWWSLIAIIVIIAAGIATYFNSFAGEFALDDLPAITENRTVQGTWADALHPPNQGQTVTGRPLVNLSFAANFKWDTSHHGDGFGVWGYHCVNLTIHILAGLALFGLVRRTLELPKLRKRFAGESVPLALAAALLWLLHPLQTESVTYVSQRAESMMGMFFLITFYCFVRGTQRWPWLWFTLAVLSDLLGVFSKEVTITAPVLILLFDYIFVVEKPAAITTILRRWPIYAGFLVAMGAQVWQALLTGNRGLSAGFGAGIGWGDYVQSQFPAITHYLLLTVWPHPLVLDYGGEPEHSLAIILPTAALILALLAITGWLLWKRPMLGFVGVCFFVILAPSSSVIPISTEIAAEHRMYLPLAALAVLAVLGLRAWLGRSALWAALPLAAMLGIITHGRNLDYRSALNLWRDATAKHPDIARAHENYGIMLSNVGRLRESVQEFETALRLRPFYPDCENNLGNALGLLGEHVDAAKHYTLAIQGLLRDSDRAVAYYNLGNSEHEIAQASADPIHDPHMQEALNDYNAAIKLRPDYASAYHNLASILSEAKLYDAAINYYLQAIQRQPNFLQAEVNVANTYVLDGHPEDALPHYQRALQEYPNNPIAHYRYGTTLYDMGKFDDALDHFARAAQLAPTASDAHYYYGLTLAKLGHPAEAAKELQTALALKPDYVEARTALNELPLTQPPLPTP